MRRNLLQTQNYTVEWFNYSWHHKLYPSFDYRFFLLCVTYRMCFQQIIAYALQFVFASSGQHHFAAGCVERMCQRFAKTRACPSYHHHLQNVWTPLINRSYLITNALDSDPRIKGILFTLPRRLSLLRRWAISPIIWHTKYGKANGMHIDPSAHQKTFQFELPISLFWPAQNVTNKWICLIWIELN